MENQKDEMDEMSEPRITILPPGEAIGARDLQNWCASSDARKVWSETVGVQAAAAKRKQKEADDEE